MHESSLPRNILHYTAVPCHTPVPAPSPSPCRLMGTAKEYAGRVVDAAKVAKEHVKAAAKNQAQAMEDVTVEGAQASTVYPEHMKEAGKDMKQWGREMGAALKGETPQDVKVRDLPPMGPGQDTVEDRVQDVKIKEQGGRAKGVKSAGSSTTASSSG